ncbi:thioredoxin reductase [candidate division MSBL1 archaeon SCGC-AAA382A13]|uniref:Thioredoxin reductase n=1 Tax=candidate division MSBL1 archaeon SCGC-AAA382A13 TaxID=1698279 RepID=A0A133VH41_9EURY|nr:thioredoxin reductase [candidate division MSBL1 archaeon SCGC-AAA382A13]
MANQDFDVIIVGAGPAGLTSGIYAARSGLETLILEKEATGGNMSDAPGIDNYPAVEEVTGMELAEKMEEHASKYVDIREIEPVEKIETGDTMRIETSENEYKSDAIILATGTEYRKLGVPGEKEFSGSGVSYCATCDGFFYKDKHVLVVGGGNAAVADASHLLDIGCDVTLVHRRDELRAEKALQESFFDKGGEIIWNSVLEEIKGEDSVESVKLRNVEEDSESELEVDGVFVSIGEVPKTDIAKSIGVELNDSGYIGTDDDQRTNIERVYAAGDVTGDPKQVIIACAEGAKAAITAYKELKNPYWV